MYSTIRQSLGIAAALAFALGGTTIVSPVDAATTGQQIAFDRSKGNCLACHQIEGGEAPGTIGPPLVGMHVRYPDQAKLRAQIWDATAINPETPMPPFGKYQILTDEELDQLVEFIWSK